MDINFEYYKIFYYVAKYKNITKAAGVLKSNQPNVTRVIKLLESQLNCALFIREPRGLKLTEEGKRLYEHVEVACHHLFNAEAELSSLGEGLGGFDLVIIDLLWWRNTKRIRFSFLPEQSHYQDPTKHVSSFLRLFPLLSSFGFLFLLILDRLIPHQHRNADHVWIRRDDGAGCRVGIKISVLPHKFFCQMERKKRIGLESKNITHCYSHFNSSARRPYGDWRR